MTDQKKSSAKPMSAPDQAATPEKELEELHAKVEELAAALQKAQEDERRAYADYQNLVRRSQEEKSKIVKLAAKDVVLALLLPLDHLHLAEQQLKDHGLTMVYQQFQQALAGQGVQEIDAMGHPFDENKMEVVDKRPVSDPLQQNVVIGVTQRGYTLHGEVIRHARVVIGVAPEKE
ncbi:nucleotide exchange factor GrpE [Patescibacteria group bacterium]|nr:nucleotide exchange factor GrpE [Patescibacteria group bacterium]